MIFVSRHNLSEFHSDRAFSLASRLKLPKTLRADEVLACDAKLIHRIQELAGTRLLVIQPNAVTPVLLELTARLDGLVMAPSISRALPFRSGRDSVRRTFASSHLATFQTSDQIFGRANLCSVLAKLILINLTISQWRIRSELGGFGWINVEDLPLAAQLVKNKKVLTEADLEDVSLRNMLVASIDEKLPTIVRTCAATDPPSLLKEIWVNGAILEEAPQDVVSAPCVAFHVPPVGQPQVVGSWERLFRAPYEPFASIHPAVSCPIKKLKRDTLKVAAECSSKRLVGTNIVSYVYGMRTTHNFLDRDTTKKTLTPDDLMISQYDEFVPQLVAEHVVQKPFDPESMSLGPSTVVYVQRVLELPPGRTGGELQEMLKKNGFDVESQVFVFPDLVQQSVVSLVVVSQRVAGLISLVYRVLNFIADEMFEHRLTGDEPISEYIRAIELIDSQSNAGGIQTYVSMRTRSVRKVSSHVFILTSDVSGTDVRRRT
jgi:hypothetical protein